jgi:hypothetical protein
MIGNVFVYIDNGSHITGTYLKTTSPYLTSRIMTAAGLSKPAPRASAGTDRPTLRSP